MIVFSEDNVNRRSYMAQQLHRLTNEARQNDIKVCYIPADFDESTAEESLAWCPYCVQETPGFVIGYIPTELRYQQLYDAALTHNVRLINSPDEMNRIMDFEQFYPLIQDLTPKSWIIHQKDELMQDFEYPLFIKGAIKSQKEKGWDACVAHNLDELKKKCAPFFKMSYSARNKAVLRKIINLKHTEKTPAGFPMGREFRVMLFNHKVIDCGYYWMTHGISDSVTAEEDKAIRELAEEASRRIGTPLAVIDIGQDTDNKWWVIETGDPQFCAVTHIPGHIFWQHLKSKV